MKESIQYQTSFFVDRSWQKINPNNQLSINMTKTKQFLNLLIDQQSQIDNITNINSQFGIKKKQQRINRFILSYIQQKYFNNSSKKQASFIKQSQYKFDLKDCLEIWRWIIQDNKSYDNHIQQDDLNQFQINKNYAPIQLKTKSSKHNKSKSNALYQLSLEDQEKIMKKSLEMVYLYQHQFKIIYNHYCKYMTQKQHQKIHTFDDASQVLETITIHRFMLFCRQFDIIKTLEFKKKNQHNLSINKNILLNIFKKCAHLQKFMNFQGFLVSLVNIAIKINQNFDLRSYMHIQLFLNSLKVRYYEQFMKKLNQLNIKYTPTEFYNCYKNILKKVMPKRKKQDASTPSLFNNPYFQQYQRSNILQKDKTVSDKLQNIQSMNLQSKESMIRSSHSVPNLRKNDYKKNLQPNLAFHNDQRKASISLLPSLQQNKYFKPVEHNYNKNNFSQYLDKSKGTQNPLSVFKNRITGYNNINSLKNKPFHMMDNPQGQQSYATTFFNESNQKHNQKINKNQVQIQNIQREDEQSKMMPLQQQNSQLMNSQVQEKVQVNKQNHQQEELDIKQRKEDDKQQEIIEKNISLANQIKQQVSQQKISSKNTKQKSNNKQSSKKQQSAKSKQGLKLPSLVKANISHKQHSTMINNIKKKLSVKDDDELLNKHLLRQQQKEKEVNGRIIEVFKSYKFNDE